MNNPGEPFPVDDLVVHVAGRGPTVIVQGPAWGPASDYLRETLAPLLAELGLEVVTFDPRNVGGSPRVDEEGAQAAEKLAEDLERLRRHLSRERFVLLGHSHGGFVALAYAILHPQPLRGLVVMNASLRGPAAATDDEVLRRALQRDPDRGEAIRAYHRTYRERSRVESDRELARWVRKAMPLSFHDSEAAERFQRRLRGATLSSVAALHRLPEPEEDRWVRERAAEIRVPALVITGASDLSTPPEDSEAIASVLANAELEIVERAGHHPWFERPDAFRRVVGRFLRRLPP